MKIPTRSHVLVHATIPLLFSRFVLRGDNCLYYYKSSKDKVPCGVIILTNYSVSKAPEINKNHCFKLTKGGARTYYMCAGSESDMKKWIMAMMDAAKVSSADVCTQLSILGSIDVTTYPSPKSQFCPN